MATAFHKSTELINLSITGYMVFQGICQLSIALYSRRYLSFDSIAPMFWGTIGDKVGRRPVFIACLVTLCLSCVGLALMPTNAYWLLVLLRCLQAAGSASTIALGNNTHIYAYRKHIKQLLPQVLV